MTDAPLTVAALIEKLQKLPQDALVVCPTGHIEDSTLATDVQIFETAVGTHGRKLVLSAVSADARRVSVVEVI